MNNWFKIAVPIVIAVLLITATVGITLAVAGKGAAGQSAPPGYNSEQATVTQYARGSQCANCAGNSQGAVTGDTDDSTGNVYVPGGAACPTCPGYAAGTTGQPATTNRGGCCRGR
jgi:hypothetical protein